MAISRTYRCPDCEGTFRFLHMNREEPPPQYCELCHSFMGEEPEAEVSAVNIGGSALAKSVASTYKTLEETTKITDLKDGLRPGDSAAASMPNNVVTQFAAQEGMQMWQGGNIGGYTAAARGGERGGIRAMNQIQNRFKG